MAKKLAYYISILVIFALVLSTGIYFYESKIVIEKEIRSQASLLITSESDEIKRFLNHIKDISFIVYKNDLLKKYLLFPVLEDKVKIEKRFLDYSFSIELIQALRLVDVNGNIKVFIKEKENLSGKQSYKEISILNKDFLKNNSGLDYEQVCFTNFERGKLPDVNDFCPAMIRTVTPLFDGNKKIGYLVINFWGKRLSEVLNILPKENGFSFMVEINKTDKNRNGIFLFHPEKKYEFANQYGTQYRLENVYGKEISETMRNMETGILKIKNTNDYLAFNTVYPYNNNNQLWKICTVLRGNYYYKNIDILRNNFLAIMFFSIFINMLASVYISKKLLTPLDKIILAFKEIGSGNLDYKINTSSIDNELSIIAETVNNMTFSLKQHIKALEEKQIKIELLNRLSSIGFLSAGISHELNTPLNSIIILCGIMEKYLPAGQKNDIMLIKEEALRCVSIIESLKQILPQYSSNPEMEPINLKRVCENAVKFMKIDDQILFRFSLQDVYILGNLQLLQTAVTNLVVNSIEAVYPKGDVSIKLYKSDNKAVLEVEDNGKGMNDTTKKHLFTPFYTTKESNNMGMGLPLVYKIVSIHNGTIVVVSTEGKGTTFRLEFEIYDQFVDSRR
jgi:signal transduction histidine kinase